jgi:hypothetical protein
MCRGGRRTTKTNGETGGEKRGILFLYYSDMEYILINSNKIHYRREMLNLEIQAK